MVNIELALVAAERTLAARQNLLANLARNILPASIEELIQSSVDKGRKILAAIGQLQLRLRFKGLAELVEIISLSRHCLYQDRADLFTLPLTERHAQTAHSILGAIAPMDLIVLFAQPLLRLIYVISIQRHWRAGVVCFNKGLVVKKSHV